MQQSEDGRAEDDSFQVQAQRLTGSLWISSSSGNSRVYRDGISHSHEGFWWSYLLSDQWQQQDVLNSDYSFVSGLQASNRSKQESIGLPGVYVLKREGLAVSSLCKLLI